MWEAKADPAAFDLLYDRYFDPVFRCCQYRLNHQAEAEDAASLIFARALAALSGFDPAGKGTFRSWLFCIAHNIIANQHRDRRPTLPLDDAFGARDPGPPPEDMAAAITGDHFRCVQPGSG